MIFKFFSKKYYFLLLKREDPFAKLIIEKQRGIFMSKINIPLTVVDNRRIKIKEYSQEYNLTKPKLAEFFQVPIKVIEEDLKTVSEGLGKGTKEFDVSVRKNEVLNEILKEYYFKEITERMWAKYGFWMEVHHFGNGCRELFLSVESFKVRSNLQRAYDMLKLGFTIADVKIICELSIAETEILKQEVNGRIFENAFQKWANEQYKNKKQKVEAVTVKDAVGVSKIKLLKGEKYYYDVKKKQNEKPASVYIPEKSQSERNEMKEKAFLIWIYGGLKQDEIAVIFKVSRVTVGNWLREMKTKYPEEMAKYRRNVDISRRGKRRDDFETYQTKIKPQLEAGKSKAALCEETGFSPNKILKFEKMGTDPFVSSKKETGPKDPMTMFRKKS